MYKTLITDLAYLDVGAAFSWFQRGRQLGFNAGVSFA
jgi:hypothetical protein